MADEWYVHSNDTLSGPYDLEALLAMVNSGQIRDDDLVSADQTAWITVADFQASFQAESPPDAEEGEPPVSRPDETVGPGPAPAKPRDSFSGGPTGVRDRIVILGRRQAGKTVYLSILYARLWRSLDGLTMSALSGLAHRDMMRAVADLENGRWPPATLENTQTAFEIENDGQKRLMISMDYSGEVFKRAFVEDDGDSREVKELIDHLDNAAAIMLVIDPSMVYNHSKDIDAAIDDDFGMVQAVKRVRNWPGGEQIPIVLVLTKMDKNLPLIRQEGGLVSFVKNHWPALARTLQRIPIYSISAVQTHKNSNGELVPSPSSEPRNIMKPLMYCLKAMGKLDQRHVYKEKQADEERLRHVAENMQAAEKRRQKIFWAVVTIAIVLIWAFVMALAIVYR